MHKSDSAFAPGAFSAPERVYDRYKRERENSMKTETFNLYRQHNTATLTTYLIHEENEPAAGKMRPGVLILPGGGYFQCSVQEAEPAAFYFNSLGYHAFVLCYSTYDSGWGRKGLPDLDQPVRLNPRVAHPAPVREVGLSMRILAEHAEEWNLDSSRIALCGFSAGAHNAAMYGVYWNEPLMTDYAGVPAERIRPAALILGHTVSDYLFLKEKLRTAPPETQKFFRASTQSFLGKYTYTKADLRDISPALLADEHFPPAFLWTTDEEEAISKQQTLRLAETLAGHKVPCEVHIYEDGERGMSQKNREVMAEWLKKRFEA